MSENKSSIVIIGGGPSAMMLACTLDSSKYDVTIVEKGKAIGKKFLVAGKGGFNLTHSEDIHQMITKYEAPPFIIEALRAFTNLEFRKWLLDLGIDTYVGSSKRVFPIKGIKPVEVLQAIKKELKRRNVTILTDTQWVNSFIENGYINLIQKGQEVTVKADKLVFAMGGSSWKVTGSDGGWIKSFNSVEVNTIPFRASNCALHINWTEGMKSHYGKPIKNIALSYNQKYIKGELMITKEGIEGSPAYALSYYIGNDLITNESVEIEVDLKPSIELNKVASILSSSDKKTSKILRQDLSLSNHAVALLKSNTTREEFSNLDILAKRIKKMPLSIIGLSDIDKAISTVGGVDCNFLNDKMELRNFPNHYVIGEMIDWNGPTGGYLLQACFSMGRQLGVILNAER